jgi:DNA-binding response OmpR family regulator
LRKKKKILVIDDEAYIRRVLELKLKKRGFQVITATNGEEGLKYFKKHHPHVVITDIKMPKIDGRGFCEQTNVLKQKRPFLTIVISCSLGGEELKWLEKMDQTIFFEKPFSPTKLLDYIDSHMGE